MSDIDPAKQRAEIERLRCDVEHVTMLLQHEHWLRTNAETVIGYQQAQIDKLHKMIGDFVERMKPQ